MPIPVVWSERPEPNASSLKDCTYSAGLMGMVYSAYAPFPLGAYTVAEREALERSDDQPNETGASLSDLALAIKRRYGKVKVVNLPASLSGLLDRSGLGLVVQGIMGNLASDRLRRWDPGFEGGHAVFVVRTSPDAYLWLDPLAPNKFAGDKVSKAQIMRFAQNSGSSMTFKLDEWKPPATYTAADLAQARADAYAQGYAEAKKKALALLGTL